MWEDLVQRVSFLSSGRDEGRGRGGRFRSWGAPRWEVGLNGQETALWRDLLEERWLALHGVGRKGDHQMSLEFLVCVADRMSPDRGDTELWDV